jgi:DNA-binding NarL/FixJ family response regulator
MRELLLATIGDQPDIEIVGEVQKDDQILPLMDQTHPHFLIIGLEHPADRPSLCDFILERFPQVRILAVDAERNASIFYWASLDIHSAPVEASEQGVLSALRSSPQVAGGIQ